MRNLLRQFREILPSSPLLVGTVTGHNPDGTSTLTMPAGGVLRAQGQSVALNGKAFVRDGRIEGEAPNLPTFDIPV